VEHAAFPRDPDRGLYHPVHVWQAFTSCLIITITILNEGGAIVPSFFYFVPSFHHTTHPNKYES
ncbi:MAG: hypothetical protein ACK5VH_00750, partial [bacterium]